MDSKTRFKAARNSW